MSFINWLGGFFGGVEAQRRLKNQAHMAQMEQRLAAERQYARIIQPVGEMTWTMHDNPYRYWSNQAGLFQVREVVSSYHTCSYCGTRFTVGKDAVSCKCGANK